VCEHLFKLAFLIVSSLKMTHIFMYEVPYEAVKLVQSDLTIVFVKFSPLSRKKIFNFLSLTRVFFLLLGVFIYIFELFYPILE